eukprot:8517988-Alexandrium_andersonii.AAC.1
MCIRDRLIVLGAWALPGFPNEVSDAKLFVKGLAAGQPVIIGVNEVNLLSWRCPGFKMPTGPWP